MKPTAHVGVIDRYCADPASGCPDMASDQVRIVKFDSKKIACAACLSWSSARGSYFSELLSGDPSCCLTAGRRREAGSHQQGDCPGGVHCRRGPAGGCGSRGSRYDQAICIVPRMAGARTLPLIPACRPVQHPKPAAKNHSQRVGRSVGISEFPYRRSIAIAMRFPYRSLPACRHGE